MSTALADLAGILRYRSLRPGPIVARRDGSAREGGAYPGLGRQIALDIARGLHFLHRHSVVHFDLKSPNVLLGRQHVAKIADVGLAKILQKDYVSSLQSFGTFAWSVSTRRSPQHWLDDTHLGVGHAWLTLCTGTFENSQAPLRQPASVQACFLVG